MDVTVVVPARNAAAQLEECLASIARNGPREVIVVDGRSTDATVEIAHAFGARIIDDGGRGLPVARALGIEAATTTWVALVDSDVVLPDHALDHLVAECAAGGFAALSAGQESVGGPGYWGRALADHHRHGRSRRWFGVVATVAERSTLLEVGFDDRFRSGEDIELRTRLEASGRRIGVSSRTVVTHRFAGDDFTFARAQFLADGEGLGRTIAKFGWRSVWLLVLPLLAAARGAAMAVARFRFELLPYFGAYLAYNYVGMARSLGGVEPGEGPSMVGSSVALSGARVGSMVLGFVFWLVAARTFDAAEVGLAAAAVASMMLCVQLAHLGLGPATLTEARRWGDRVGELLSTASRVAAVGAVVVAVGFLAGVRSLVGVDGAGAIAAEVPLALLFLALTVLSAWNFLLDHAQLVVGQADRTLTRNLASSAVTLGVLATMIVLGADDAAAIVGAWVVGMVVATIMGVEAVRGIVGWRAPTGRAARRLLAVGLPNHVLTLAERVPGFVLPIVVVELLGPAANAVWYTAWMMAWAAYFVPQSVGVALMASASDDPAVQRQRTAYALRSASSLGAATAAVLAVVGPVLMLLLGDGYGDGIGPLLILLVAVLPGSLVQTYFALCRSQGRLVEANSIGLTFAVVAITAAWIGAEHGRLVGIALGWLGAQTAAAVLAAVQLWRYLRPSSRLLRADPAVSPADGAGVPT